jgi:hypothetical protein
LAAASSLPAIVVRCARERVEGRRSGERERGERMD